MFRNRLALFSTLCLLLASASAEAGRPRGGMQVLDRDAVLLPYAEQDSLYRIVLMADAGGQLLLLDQSDATPMRVTPLGLQMPGGSTWGNYTATPDGHVWAALASAAGVRVYDLGDLQQPGPLAPVALESVAVGAGFQPRDTRMGIIAVLIGLLVEPRPSIACTAITDGTSNTITFAWDGSRFSKVKQNSDGTWSFDTHQ